MTDLSPLLTTLLKAHNTHLRTHRRKQSDITDEFLKEAYRIVRTVHPHHLSPSASPFFLFTFMGLKVAFKN